MWRGRVAVVAVLAAGCGGSDEQEERPEREAARAQVTLTVSREDILLGAGMRVLGELRVDGRPTRGNVTIEQDPWPFSDDGFEKLRTVRTRGNGHWGTPVHPRRNTRFRAVASGARSEPATTHVWARRHVDVEFVDAYTARTQFTVTLPPRVPQRRVRVYAYESVADRQAYRRVASARLSPAGRRMRAEIRHRSKAPPGVDIRVYVCYARPVSPALGRRGEGSDEFCGSRRLSRLSSRL